MEGGFNLKRSVGLFLALVFLISYLPIVAEGVNFFKDIDVIFADLKLNVNGKKIINHKEPFLYDDNFYVSLSDLAKGLTIDIRIDGDKVYLDTNNKLNVDSYNSKLPQVFQRGYEVLAKEKMMEALQEEIRALEGKSRLWKSYDMKYVSRNIRVGFGNIYLYLDGKKIDLDEEVLKYNNDIYVALDSIAPYLYIIPELSRDKTTINIDTNGILGSNTNSIDYILAGLNGRNYLLDLQKSELEKRKEIIEGLKIPYKKIDSISSLKSYINSNFNKISDLTVAIDLSEVSNWIYLDISFPSSRNHLWTRLTRLDVENWIWNIYTAIVKLYNEDVRINGIIRNPYYSKYSSSNYRNYVSFYSVDYNIFFDFSNSSLSTDEIVNPNLMLELLNSNMTKFNGMSFSYELERLGDNIHLKIYPTTDTLSKQSIFAKMGYLRTLNQRIRSAYPNIDIYGQIIYPGDIEPLSFYIKDNRIRSSDLLEETMEYINAGFSFFSTGIYGYRLNYSIYEMDLVNFHLMAEGDFSVEDDKWIYGGELAKERLSSIVNQAVSTIASIWDANITVDILDKDGVAISEFKLLQESVSAVTAEPSGGTVVEGQRVYLYTATPAATIYYTTDGSTPTESDFVYDGRGIQITSDTIIKAVAYKEGLNPSPVATFSYTIDTAGNMSQGLYNLIVSNGNLAPSFSQNILEYTVNVDNNVSRIYITPYAITGIIRINGNIVISGTLREVVLNQNSTVVNIEVKEDNKLPKIYKLVINKAEN